MGGRSGGAGGGGGSGGRSGSGELSQQRMIEIDKINDKIHQVNNQVEGAELDIGALTGSSSNTLQFKGRSYEHDVAPRISDGLSALRGGNVSADRALNLLSSFVGKNQDYKNISKTVGSDVRKSINQVFDALVNKASSAAVTKVAKQMFASKSPQNLSPQEKGVLVKAGLRWNGSRWQ